MPPRQIGFVSQNLGFSCRLLWLRLARKDDRTERTLGIKWALPRRVSRAAGAVVPEGATADQAEYNYQLLLSQVGEHRAKLAAFDRQQQKEEQNRAAIASTVHKLTVALPMLRERMEARKYLYEKEIGSKLTYLEVAQDYAEQELQVQRHRLSEADNAVAAIMEQHRQAEAEYAGRCSAISPKPTRRRGASRRNW